MTSDRLVFPACCLLALSALLSAHDSDVAHGYAAMIALGVAMAAVVGFVWRIVR